MSNSPTVRLGGLLINLNAIIMHNLRLSLTLESIDLSTHELDFEPQVIRAPSITDGHHLSYIIVIPKGVDPR